MEYAFGGVEFELTEVVDHWLDDARNELFIELGDGRILTKSYVCERDFREALLDFVRILPDFYDDDFEGDDCGF